MYPDTNRPSENPTVHVSDVHAAFARIRPHLGASPLVHSPGLGAALKLECLQLTGSYKVRGALNALASRVERRDRRPVVAASAGNHARGVAWAAERLGLAAHVFMPEGAPRVKVDGARRLGAQVFLRGRTFEEARAAAEEHARTHELPLVAPFDDPDVIAGQGTVGLELLEAEAEPDVVLVPVGGGGLASGVGLALRDAGVRVVGVQVEGVDGMARALSGLPELERAAETIADGVRVRLPGHLTRRICADVLDDVVVVSEAEVRRAMADLAHVAGIMAEGAGALAVAALPRVAGRRKVAVVSGGNVDPDVLRALLRLRGRRAAVHEAAARPRVSA